MYIPASYIILAIYVKTDKSTDDSGDAHDYEELTDEEFDESTDNELLSNVDPDESTIFTPCTEGSDENQVKCVVATIMPSSHVTACM